VLKKRGIQLSIAGPQNWGWLRRIVEKQVARSVERIWKEDLDVEVCYGGWPGISPPASEEGT